jgi:Cu2+-exporting ATPase
VLLMFGAALASFWWWLPQGAGHAFPIALAVLVAACPCALALAVPATLSAAADALARRGVLVLGADAIEALAKVDTVLFDKTARSPRARRGCARCSSSRRRGRARAGGGTGTRQPASARARLRLGRRRRSARAACIRAAASRATAMARACAWAAPISPPAAVDDDALWLGAMALALARFEVEHALRATPRCGGAPASARPAGAGGERRCRRCGGALLRAARHRGLGSAAAATRQARAAARMQAAGHRVLAVGDGLNDAPLLAGADVSAAIGAGSALAKRSAHLLLAGERLAPLADAVRLARPCAHDHAAEPGLGRGLQPGRDRARRERHDRARLGRARHGRLLARRHPQCTCARRACPAELAMTYLLALIPVALVLLALAVLAFAWAVRSGQFEDIESASARHPRRRTSAAVKPDAD